MATKLGCKRTEPKKLRARNRRPLRRVSKELSPKLGKLSKLVISLRTLCDNKSELDGSIADWRTAFNVEDHHIEGRRDNLLNPFKIIMVTRTQHDLMDGNTYEEKQALIEFIKPIRIAQGFKLEDYEKL